MGVVDDAARQLVKRPAGGGAAGLSLFESPRLGRLARPVLLLAAVLLLAVPAFLGAGVQRIAAMRMFSPVRVPLGLVRAGVKLVADWVAVSL